jgi:glucose-6-phosphate 1-dehydrogenase
VEITRDETLTVEGRAGSYDEAGALRDMIQNQLLQLLCLVATRPRTSQRVARHARRPYPALATGMNVDSDRVE